MFLFMNSKTKADKKQDAPTYEDLHYDKIRQHYLHTTKVMSMESP